MGSVAADEPAEKRVRLHITPFNSELLKKIIAPSILPLASNISFHAEQTFPERGFGYIELPTMAAQKVKQKLNGSTLKGSKVHIEEAKPERKRKIEEDIGDDEGTEEAKKAKKRVKKEKRKREDGVISGHELEEGRRVKRGWTDGEAKNPKKKKSSKKIADEADDEGSRKLRFKTVVPPNTIPLVEDAKDKPKKKKEEDTERRRDKKKVVVEEFKRTKKSKSVAPLPSNSIQGASTYEDGRGWVDESGNVVEPERPSKKPKRRNRADITESAGGDVENGDHSMGGTGHEVPDERDQGRSQVEDDEEIQQDLEGSGIQILEEDHKSDDTAAENDSVDSAVQLADQEIRADEVLDDQQAQHTSHATKYSPQGQERATPPSKEVHPLEALFKKPAARPDSASRPRPGPIDTSFNFFDANPEQDDEDVDTDLPPQTPHTKRDLEWRSLRSAAPTPDTAAIGRKFSFPFAGEEDEEDDAMDDGDGEDVETQDELQTGSGAVPGVDTERGEESAFRKWFYEHRGEFNRGWKKRRREERKQKRQRENRRFSQKVA